MAGKIPARACRTLEWKTRNFHIEAPQPQRTTRIRRIFQSIIFNERSNGEFYFICTCFSGCVSRVRKSNYLVVVKTSSQEEGVSRREWLLVYLVSQTLKPVNDLFLYSAFLSIKYLIFDLLFTHVSWLRRCLGSFRLIQIFSVLDLSRLSCEKLIFSKDLNLVLQMAISTWRPVARGRRKCADFSDEFYLSPGRSLVASCGCPDTLLANFSIKIISGLQHKRHRSLFAEGKNHKIPKIFIFDCFSVLNSC